MSTKLAAECPAACRGGECQLDKNALRLAAGFFTRQHSALRWWLLCGVMFIAVVDAIAGNADVPANLISNPGFEEDANKSGKDVWILGAGSKIVTGNAAEGNASLRISSSEKGMNSSAFLSGIPTAPGKRYRLIFATKAGGGTNQTTGYDAQYYRVLLNWDQLCRNGIYYGNIEQTEGEWQDSANVWQRRTIEFTAPNKPTAGMKITCEVRGPGAILLDDFVLTEIPAAKVADKIVRIRLDKPCYRNTIFATLPDDVIEGVVMTTNNAVKSLGIIFESESLKIIFSQEIPSTGNQTVFSFAVKDLALGSYKLRVKALSSDGKLIDEETEIIQKRQAVRNEVIVRGDNVCLVNGQPFFPIGLFTAPESEKALSELARAGFNFIGRITCDGIQAPVTPDVLDKFVKYNLMAVAELRYKMSPQPEERKQWEANQRKFIQELTQHPAFFGYFIADEPLWNGYPLEQLIDIYRFYRQIDPYHPVWINEAPRGAVADCANYARACDITGVDIYPVPEGGDHSEMADKTISCVGKYADKMRSSVENRKPVWMVLQGIGWADSSGNTVCPTWEETRFMAYDSILHGANGIIYWGTYAIRNWDFWKTLFRIASELRDMSRVFVSPNIASSPIMTDASEIVWVCKEYDGQIYVIAANEGKQIRNAEFRGSSAKDLHVLFENRKVAVRDGAFIDRFGPNEVHIYSTAAQLPPPLVASPVLKGEPIGEGMEDLYFLVPYKPYSGKADWIWYPGLSGTANAISFFRRTFNVPSNISSAIMTITADDEYILYINGRQVPVDKTGSWTRAERFSVAADLRRGTNTIAVKAKDRGAPPCALLMELVIVMSDGKTISFETNGEWLAHNREEMNWEKPDYEDLSWRKAEIVAPYGGGPWLRGVYVHEQKK